MLTHTRRTVHYGVACVFSPQPVLDQAHALAFQKVLGDGGLVFTQTQMAPGALALTRATPRLEVRVQQVGPGVGMLLAIDPAPAGTLDEFLDEAKTIFEGYTSTWSGQKLQVIQRECTVRQLYDVDSDHSFRFLWERRLGCQEAELSVFNRPVAGGGIRLVIPPTSPEAEEPEVEVKIESFLADSKKLFIEVVMRWHAHLVQEHLDPKPMMVEADHFLATEVVAFLRGDGHA